MEKIHGFTNQSAEGNRIVNCTVGIPLGYKIPMLPVDTYHTVRNRIGP